MTIKATWHGRTIAASEATVVIENNHYFDPVDVDQELLMASDTTTHCPWKGDASYYSIGVDGEVNADAAWYYPDPKEAAINIKDRIAFWRGVEITET